MPADELARAKGYLLGRYAMDRRTNERLAWYLAFYEVEGVGRAYPDRYRARVEAVTAADVQRVARTYLASPTTVILGPPLSLGRCPACSRPRGSRRRVEWAPVRSRQQGRRER